MGSLGQRFPPGFTSKMPRDSDPPAARPGPWVVLVELSWGPSTPREQALFWSGSLDLWVEQAGHARWGRVGAWLRGPLGAALSPLIRLFWGCC